MDGSPPTDTQADIYVGGSGNDSLSPRQGDDVIHGDGLGIYIPPLYYDATSEPDTVGFRVDTQFGSDHNYGSLLVPTEVINITNTFGSVIRLYYVEPNGELHYLLSVMNGATASFALPQGSTIFVADSTSQQQVQYVIDTDTTTYGTAGVLGGFTIPPMAEGNDDLRGGAGNDTIYGDDGNDTLYGGAPATATAVGDSDTLGGNGDDFLDGGAGDDLAFGDVGNDTLTGGAGNDTLNGQAGDDAIQGGAGSDVIDGGAGSDAIRGDYFGALGHGTGYLADFVPASYGSASYYYRWQDEGATYAPSATYRFSQDASYLMDLWYVDPDGSLVHLGLLTGGSTRDLTLPVGAKLIYSDESGQILGLVTDLVPLDPGNPVATTNFPSEHLNITASDYDGAADSILGGAGNDTIYGDQGNDTIGAGADDDIVYGGSGNDSIQGGTNTTAGDTLSGGDGSDTIYGDNIGDDTSGGGDFILGGAGNDLIHGQAGNDALSGGTDNDTIFGGIGDDNLTGNSGNDSIDGGEGNDTLLGDGVQLVPIPGTVAAVSGVLTSGAGSDYALENPSAPKITVNFVNPSPDRYDLYYVDPDGTLQFRTFGLPAGQTRAHILPQGANFIAVERATGAIVGYYENVSGTVNITPNSAYEPFLPPAGSDTLIGGIGDDFIDGMDGDDSLSGGDGNDTILGNAGHDLIDGGAGNDSLLGQDGNDTIRGGLGNDIIQGGTGADSLHAGPGDDTISGGEDNDTIDGDMGADSIHGDAGNDRIFAGAGDDTIYGGTGDDSLHAGPGDDTLIGGDGIDTIDGDTGADSILAGAGDDRIFGASGDDIIFGNAGNDLINAGTDADIVYGGEGADTIDAGAGNDTLDGQSGIDQIIGGAGDDQINVGRGDTATGGADRDTFTLGLVQTGPGTTFTIDGNTESSTAGDADDYDVIDVLGSGLTVVSNTRTLDADGNSYSGTLTVTDGTTNYTVNYSEIERVICFVRGTLIETISGQVPVESLQAGDLIRTKDNGYKPISWIGSHHLSAAMLEGNDKHYPVRIAAGALGEGYPARDLCVSPQHRILVKSRIARHLFGAEEVLVAAKQLLMMDGIDLADDFDNVEYFHFLLDQHEIVYANGSETESLFTGPEALKAVDPEALEEILSLFPELSSMDYTATPARMIPLGKKVHELGRRHKKNARPLFQ
ncbi:MAG: Hint domain-containing protein [Pseudorhodobacter sp.]